MNAPGMYGKLPTHGDFVQRNLPTAFVSEWDDWLQHFVAGTKEKLGPDWLDIYLTSPIWRFVLSHGVIDEHKWAGIMMPSVDMVGRYFPFSIAMRLPDYINPLEYISMQSTWYEELEDLALRALDGEFELDELAENLANSDNSFDSLYQPGSSSTETFSMNIAMGDQEQSINSVYPHMLDVMMNKLLSSYSVWSTLGSNLVEPCVFSVQNLPVIAKLPAMMDGDWQRWGWQQPYVLQSVSA